MRCFLAIDLPEGIKKRFRDVQRSFYELGKIKFVEHDNLHITLKFFGDVDEKTLKKLKEAYLPLEEVTSFRIKFKGLGAFPKKDYARVIWAGIVGLDGLQEKVTKIAEEAGFESQRKETPHLTLGRVKSVHEKARFIEKLNQKESFGSMNVKEVKLKKSVLTKKGPIYDDVHVFRLKTEGPS